MYPLLKRARHQLNASRLSGIAMLIVILAACNQPVPMDQVAGSPEPRLTWDEYIASLRVDDFGPYKVVGGEWIESESGFRLGLEARQYVLEDASRFVVVQSNLVDRVEPAKGMTVELVIRDSAGNQPSPESLHVATNLDLQKFAESEVLLASAPMPVLTHPESVTKRPCAILVVDYTSDAFFDRTLDTCRESRR